jgi:CheY-like chemotaxis protein
MYSFSMLDDISVVIVDDDDDIRSSLTDFLSQRGATVFACSNAREALQAVRAHHPNIVLSDIGLPNRDGFQLLQDIRSLDMQHGCDVPVIAMTAFGWSGDRPQKLWAFEAHLAKPFKPNQLLSTLVSTLDSRRS